MTSLTKAPRPCTLPKYWVSIGEGIIDSNNGFRLKVNYCLDSNKTIFLCISGSAIYRKEIKLDRPSKYQGEVRKAQLEVALAIASAQRPWLKADGYQFVEGQRYEVLHIHGGKLMHDIGEFGNYNGVYGIDSSNFAEVGYIKAFKPLDDSPEAWEALAHVEVYEETK